MDTNGHLRIKEKIHILSSSVYAIRQCVTDALLVHSHWNKDVQLSEAIKILKDWKLASLK